MRISILKTTHYCLLIVVCLLLSCKHNCKSVDLLNQAQNVIDNNPQEALVLLDSISNPKKMNIDNYMQFIVAHMNAKYKNKQDITKDTLIFDALKYFENTNDFKNAALAHLDIGALYVIEKKPDKSLISLLKAESYAEQTDNNILKGRVFTNIGIMYHNQNLLDSAIVNLKLALHYYNKEEDIIFLKLQATGILGVNYAMMNESDSAFLYINRALEMANSINDRSYIAAFTNNLAVTYYNIKDYDKTAEYLNKSLAASITTKDSLMVYFNLSELHANTGRGDSVKYYIDLVKERLTHIQNNYALKAIYEGLSNYNKGIGNLGEALYYSELEKEASEKLNEEMNPQQLLNIKKKYQISLKEKETDSLLTCLYLCISIFFIILIGIISWLTAKHSSLKYAREVEKNKLLEQRFQNLSFLQSIYHDIISKWGSIEKEVKSLAIEYGAQKEPALYRRVRKMVGNVTDKTNVQLIENTKELIRKEPWGETVIKALNSHELLILMLSYCDYSEEEITTILGQPTDWVNLTIQKSGIRRKLADIGISEPNINKLLFSKNIQLHSTLKPIY